MTSIKNDRPTGGARTASTNEAKGPAPEGQSGIDDLEGVTDIEALEGMSLENGASYEPPPPPKSKPTTSVPRSSTTRAGADVAVKANDESAITALVQKTIGSLKPGETAVLGAKLEAAVEVAVGLEIGLTFGRREDGKFTVTLEQEGFFGVGGEVGVGKEGASGKAGVKGGLTGATAATMVFDTAEQAAMVAAEMAAAAVAGANIPIPGGALLAATTVPLVINRDAISSIGVSVGAEVEVELELELFQEMKAKFGAGIAIGFTFEPPDQAFLELKGEATAAAESSFGDLEVMSGNAGGDGEITVRVPLGRVGSQDALADPAMQKALLDKVGPRPAGTTMSFEGKLAAGAVVAGVDATVTKEVKGNRLDDLFADGGWQLQVDARAGDKLGGKIGVGTLEVAMSRSYTIYDSAADSLADAAWQVGDRSKEIEAKAKELKP